MESKCNKLDKDEVVKLLENLTKGVVQRFIDSATETCLENMCTKVCDSLIEEIKSKPIPNVCLSYVIGTWRGPVKEQDIRTTSVTAYNCNDVHCVFESSYLPHQWMCARLGNERVLQFDPTYIQFTGTEWCWEECVDAIKYCVANEDGEEYTSLTEEYEARKRTYST